jgi:hypothetical protein
LWSDLVETFLDVPGILDSDPQLAAFWRAAWESEAGITLPDALKRMRDASLRDLDAVHACAKSMVPQEYLRVLEAIGCTSQEFRGAGFKTALAAAVLACMHRAGSPTTALAQAANELESDTDTIGTMAGAILGACAKAPPEWAIQDRDYIVVEATRLARIAAGHACESFVYPDLARWSPPASQLAAVGTLGENLALAGLGIVSPQGLEYRVGDSIWQWCRLPFGQTVLAKRKAALTEVSPDQMPGHAPCVENGGAKDSNSQPDQSAFAFEEDRNKMPPLPKPDLRHFNDSSWSIDRATDEAIRSNFDPVVVGELFNKGLDETESIEQVIAFAAILAKARLARRRKHR